MVVGFGMVCGMPLTIRHKAGRTYIQANSYLRRGQWLWPNRADTLAIPPHLPEQGGFLGRIRSHAVFKCALHAHQDDKN